MSDVPPPPPPPPPGYGATAAGGGGATPPLAEIGPRLIALLIDFGIMFGGYIALVILSGIFGAVSDALGLLVLLIGWVALFGFTIYNFYYLEGTTGQTIGKKMQNVKVVGLENGGQPIGALMAFVRYLINSFCFILWLWALWDPQRQTIGDKVTKSVVVVA